MKTIFFILIMVISVGIVNAVQPARKPFLHLKIDGNPIKTGEILKVNKGQKLKVEVEMEGGRQDFCNFPEEYADVSSAAQILSRGNNGLTYELDGKKTEWKLLSETFQFTGDDAIKINSSPNQPTAEIIVSNEKFEQTSVKVTVKAIWQFTDGETVKQEENIAETSVYFIAAGTSDIWFLTQNIKVSGIKNELVQEKLILLQATCDSVKKYLLRLNFPLAQQAIRNLQIAGNNLKSAIDEVTAGNPAYKAEVDFIGLPSDHSFGDITLISNIKTAWQTLETLLNDFKQKLGSLPQQPTEESKDQLVKLIESYTDWQSKLPDQTFDHLNQYISDIHVDSIQIPDKLRPIKKEKDITDYTQTLSDLNSFIDQRLRNVSDESQSINAISNRIQAVRLFDGMLRSYFASITWGEWVNTRQ